MSPTTGVGSTAVNRSHSSSRSATPLLSPYGNSGNRPPILDALPVLRGGMSVATAQQSDIRFDFPPTTNSTGHQMQNTHHHNHQHPRQNSSREKSNYSGSPSRSHGQNQPAYQLYQSSNNNKLTREQSGWWSMESGDYWRTGGTLPEGYSSHHELATQGYGTPYGYGYGNSSYTMPSSAYPSSYQSTFYDPRYPENRSYSPDTFNHHYQENPPSSSYSGGQNNSKQWW